MECTCSGVDARRRSVHSRTCPLMWHWTCALHCLVESDDGHLGIQVAVRPCRTERRHHAGRLIGDEIDKEEPMTALSHRERVLRAVNHQEPDRVPIDLGGTTATSIFLGAYERLREHLGLALSRPVQRVYAHTDIVRVDPAVVDRCGGDVLPIQVEGTNVLHYADQTTPLADGGYVDEYGVIFERPEGSPYALVARAPFAGDPDVARIARHPWPDPNDPRRIAGLAECAARLRATSDRALAIGLPARFLSFGQNLCGFADWMMFLSTEPVFVEALLDKALENQMGICAQVLDTLGDNVDIVMFADDLGTEQSLQISPAMYRSLIKPRQKALFDAVRQRTEAKIFFHSDGAIASILPDLIEVGVDIINPVQPTCAGMDTARLKRDFGRDITFWGSVDTQHVLPFGTPAQVADEVRRRIDDLAPGGGFVLAAVHNIQPDVPPENIVALFDTALAYGRYH
jgi:uroporphyrinogen decarboxylase